MKNSKNVAKIFLFFFVATLFLLNAQITTKNNENFLKITDLKINDKLYISQQVQWKNNGTLICNASYTQESLQIISDEASGGAIIAWMDRRIDGSNRDIYAQKVDANGKGLWGVNGTVICNATDNQWDPQLISDETGGAIIVWQDGRDLSVNDYDIYAQKVNAIGIGLWGANGTVVCNATDYQGIPQIISDGAGGAIIVWQDRRIEVISHDIYVQKIDANGIGQWGANGTIVCNATNQQYNLQIIGDGAGGATIVWQDVRFGTGTDNIYAQKVNTNGIGQWGTNGTAICNEGFEQRWPQFIRVGTNEAIIAWQDNRNDDDEDNIYAQKVNTNGIGQWGANGTVICNATAIQQDPRLVSDGASGAIIVWQDYRNPVSPEFNIYAQKVNTNGIDLWGANGTVICNAFYTQEYPQLVSDGTGGAIIAWQDWRTSGTTDIDIYAQKIDTNGIGQWGANGTVVCNINNEQIYPQLVGDGTGGAIIAWQDKRIDNVYYDIYAQRISHVTQGGTSTVADDDDDDDDDEKPAVSLGSYYLIFIMVGIISLIFIYKRKLNSGKK